jgi:hypothetical protein
MTAMGGTLVGLHDNDVSLAWFNPAALHKDMNGAISFNHDRLFAGVGSSYVAAAKHSNKLGLTFHTALQYLSYGTFDATDEYANSQGTFTGQDMAIGIGAAKPLSERWSLGLNLKYIYSNLESYSASGLSSDVGALYYNPEKRFSFGATIKNAGVQLATYAGEKRGRLPLNIELGIVKRLAHLPLQYAISYRNLESWNVTYKDPNIVEETDILGQTKSETSALVKQLDNFARHLTLGTELLLGQKENFRLRLGYSHLLKKEMRVAPYRSLTGFSYGFGFKIKRFRLDLGRSITHMVGGMTHFTFATNLSEFKRK